MALCRKQMIEEFFVLEQLQIVVEFVSPIKSPIKKQQNWAALSLQHYHQSKYILSYIPQVDDSVKRLETVFH